MAVVVLASMGSRINTFSARSGRMRLFLASSVTISLSLRRGFKGVIVVLVVERPRTEGLKSEATS